MNAEALLIIGFILVTLPSAFVLTMQSLFYLRGRGYQGKRREGLRKGLVSVIVPVRKEPTDLLDDALGYLSRMNDVEVIVASDDPPERLGELLGLVERWRRRGLNVLLLWRRRPRGFRTGALNDGLRLSSGRYIYVMDVDSRIDPGFFDEAAAYIDEGAAAVVARWSSRGYDNRLSEALTASMEYIVDSIYVGRSSLGLPVFPVGTGTLYDKRFLLDELGGWDEARLQDDMEIGARIMYTGRRIIYLDHRRVRLDVPRRLRSLRIQQERWAYGATDAAIARLRHILFSPQPFYARIEALTFLLQYTPMLLTLIGFIVIAAVTPLLHIDPFSRYWYIGLPWLAAAALYVYSFTDCLARKGWPRKRALVNLGRIAAATTSLTPTVSRAILRALARRPFVYRRTPKGSYEARGGRARRTPWELIIGLAAVAAAPVLLASGAPYTAAWSITYSLGYLYSFARWREDILYA